MSEVTDKILAEYLQLLTSSNENDPAGVIGFPHQDLYVRVKPVRHGEIRIEIEIYGLDLSMEAINEKRFEFLHRFNHLLRYTSGAKALINDSNLLILVSRAIPTSQLEDAASLQHAIDRLIEQADGLKETWSKLAESQSRADPSPNAYLI